MADAWTLLDTASPGPFDAWTKLENLGAAPFIVNLGAPGAIALDTGSAPSLQTGSIVLEPA